VTRKRGPRRADDRLEWRDEAGTVHSDSARAPRPIPSWAQVPRVQRLATVTCTEGHIVAVVQRPNASSPAMVRVQAQSGIGFAILAIVTDEGIGYALTDLVAGTVGMSPPGDSVVVPCSTCSQTFELLAAQIPTAADANTVGIVARVATA
jgi:hypothetical protein